MKRISSLLLSLWVLLPTSLSAQLVRQTPTLSVLRYSDYASIKVDKSFKMQNNRTFISSISSDGKYFVGANQQKFSDYIFYEMYNSESGEIKKTEKHRPLNYMFVGDKLLTLYPASGIAMTDLNTMTLRWHHRVYQDKPFYIHRDILLSLDHSNDEMIYGLDLSHCSSTWIAHIPHRGGIRTIQELDEENLLIVADQLVKLNTRTGAMQSLKIKTILQTAKRLQAISSWALWPLRPILLY